MKQFNKVEVSPYLWVILPVLITLGPMTWVQYDILTWVIQAGLIPSHLTSFTQHPILKLVEQKQTLNYLKANNKINNWNNLNYILESSFHQTASCITTQYSNSSIMEDQ